MTVPSKFTIIYIILHLIFIFTECKYPYSGLNPTLEDQLNKETRRAECCAKKMRCCKRHPPPPNIEIRAVMTRCIDPPYTCFRNRLLKKPLNPANMHNLQRFQGFDEDEPLVQSEVTKCARKLILTLKIRNDGDTNTQNQFIVVDHVYDPLSDRVVRLLNPYVIKMKQEQISQDYAMKFIDFVNSQAREQVYNKHDGNYTGCCTEERRPTCGIVKFHGKPVPYSTGFCCSCDAQKNVERQPLSEDFKSVGYSDPAYLLDSVPCPRSHIGVSVEQLRKDDERTKQKLLKSLHKHQQAAQKAAEALEKGDQKRNKESDNIFYIGLQKNSKGGKKITKRNRNYPDQLELKETDVPSDRAQEYDEIAPLKVDTIQKQLQMYKDNINSRLINSKSTESLNSKEDSQKKHIRNRLQKPSMHEILNSDAQNSNKLYNLKSSIKKIADKAFKDAFQSTSFGKSNPGTPLEKEAGLSPEEFEFNLPANVLEKRQIQSSGVQRRGGQNCADRYTPPNLDPETYHESTHCLKFSPVWYGVYKLGKPVVEQRIVFQVFQKYETPCGKSRWKDLTKGKKVKLGTFWPQYKDDVPTISMRFASVYDDEDFCLDYKELRLLVPEGLKLSDLVKYPEARAGPPEFLLVPKEKIMITGDQCNVAGIGFEAFFKQPNRCSMPRGSCLHHQPFHLWHHDKRLERTEKTGCYFLKYYGVLSDNPIRRNATGGEKLLSLNYYGRYISLIDMEINGDFNAVLRTASSAVITEVYIDSTCDVKTSFTIKVSNNGLLSSRFMVRICDCPLDVESKFSDVQSDLATIPPQVQHVFNLVIRTPLKLDLFYCSAEVLNAEKELVALRRIKIQKMDRCVCSWYCLCACIGSSTGLKCIPMKIDHYHAAGFKGGLPIISRVDHFTLSGDISNLIFFVLLFVIFLLFILGLTKALLGLCCVRIGMWGLNALLDLPKPMNRYYDKDIMDRPVRYDASGWPIHPDTGERTRNIPASTEFCINVMFFFTYPTVMFILLLKRICRPFHKYPRRKLSNGEGRGRWKCSLKSCIHRKEPDEEKPNKKTSKKKIVDESPQETKTDTDQAKEPSKKQNKVSINEGPKNQRAPSQHAKSAKSAGGDTTDNPYYYYTSTDENTSQSTSAAPSVKESGKTNTSRS